MTLTQLTNTANSLTDENFSTTQVFNYANVAISKINVSVKSSLPPFVSTPSTDYTSLSDDWINLVVLPHVCWSIKMNDGSVNEARDFLYQFETGMRALIRNKKQAIAESFQGDGFKSVYPITNYNKM